MKLLAFILLLCNFSSSICKKSQRIIGGETAVAGRYPFSAAIYKSTPNGQYFCGGTLYTAQWLITAAQCVDGADLFTIYLGTTNIKSPNPETSVRVATEEYVSHPDYNPLTLEHDIGLIMLRMPIELSNYVQIVHQLSPYEIQANSGLEAIGWGQVSDANGGIEDELRWVKLTALSNEECRITYGNQITDQMVCVVGNYNEGTCTGDTGSPLILWIRGSYSGHAGIASFVSGNGCESTDPSGYTRTLPYATWIRNTTTTNIR